MIYRAAKNKDKYQILDFCKNTFEWGDYIHEVWDIWIKEKNGLLMVAETKDEPSHTPKSVAMIHGILYDHTIWIEGIRVNPVYRRKGLASTLINQVIRYGKERKAKKASSVVSVKNNPSKKLMKKQNFIPVAKWIYSTTYTITKNNDKCFDKIIKAEIKHIKVIKNFLSKLENDTSDIIRFVNAWRWYTLTENQLYKIIINSQLYIFHDKKIRGMVIIDSNPYFNKGNYEIGYLYGETKEIVANLINYCSFMAKLSNCNSKKNCEMNRIPINDNINDYYKKMNIFCPDITINCEALLELQNYGTSKFIVYDKKL